LNKKCAALNNSSGEPWVEQLYSVANKTTTLHGLFFRAEYLSRQLNQPFNSIDQINLINPINSINA
jgi:hypothetical protein